MRKQILALALTVLLLAVSLPASAIGEAPIRVGYIDYDAFIQPDAEGVFTGYGAEYLDQISKYTGWRYQFFSDTWENCLEKLRTGKIDLLCTAQYTPERAAVYDYAKYPLGVEYGILYVARNNESVYYNDYEAFDGMRVGLLKDSFQTQAFGDYAQRHGFSFVPIEYFTDREMMEALKAGEVDAIAAGSLARKTDLKPVAKFSLDNFYFITKKNNPTILDPLNNALEELKMTDPYLDARLYEKYYGDSVIASKPMLTRNEAAYIQAHPVLRVGCKPDWSPYEYVNGKGECDGLCVDLLERVSKISGIDFDYVPVASNDARIALKNGDVDLVASVCPLDNADPTVTSPYITVPMQMIGTQNSMNKSEDYVLALEKGAKFTESYLFENFSVQIVRLYDDLSGCLDAVARGDADVTMAGNYAVNRIIQGSQYKNLMVVQSEREEIPLSMNLSRHLPPEAGTVLNKSIAFLSEAEQEKALQNMNLSYMANPTFSDFWEQYRYQIMLVCIAVVAAAGGGAAFLYYMQKRKFEFESTHDPLTGCLSIGQFKKEAAALLNRYGIHDYYILRFDILHLKYINQKYGTKTGDALLRTLAQRVQEELGPHELLGRVVDDHFSALMTRETFAQNSQAMPYLLDKIKCALKIDAPLIVKSGAYKLNDPAETVSAMLDKAAIAQKSIKQSAKRNVMVYNDTLYQQLLTESQIESEMASALAQGQFQVFFQPQIDLVTMRASAAEALVRWIRPDGTMVGPDLFIPLFERNGFVEQLDFYVLDQVCQWLRNRIDKGVEAVPISVNQSRFLLFNPDYVRDVERILRQYDIPRNQIALELTESMCLENGDVLLSTMARLHELNVQISIDDFGSGYSSLNLLSEMPADELKIDRGFLSGSTDSIPKRQVIAKVVELAKTLKIRVVCEGVETKEQENFLKSVGCDLAQGFLYARPMPLQQFEELLDSDKIFEDVAQEIPAAFIGNSQN